MVVIEFVAVAVTGALLGTGAVALGWWMGRRSSGPGLEVRGSDLVPTISARSLVEAPRGDVVQASVPAEDPMFSEATIERGAQVLMQEAQRVGTYMTPEEARAHAEELLAELGGR